jgi:hypothetical protein
MEAHMGKEVPLMVSGLGMGIRLISTLTTELKQRGGREEMLHFLTTEDGLENLGKIADLIVSLPWRVPKSVLMRMSREHSHSEWVNPPITDEYFFWGCALQMLGIPYIVFRDDEEASGDEHPISELREQLNGKRAGAGLVVRWHDEDYVLTEIDFIGLDVLPYDAIKIERVEYAHLVPARYIDLDR